MLGSFWKSGFNPVAPGWFWHIECILFEHISLISPGQHGRHFAYNIFRCIFVNEKSYILIKISLKFFPKFPNWQWPSISLDNGLAPNRRQAIIWTNANPIHWSIYAALGGDELSDWCIHHFLWKHYNDVIMSAIASRITSLTIVYSTVNSGAFQRKHQSSTSLAFVQGIHRWPVNSLHKRPVTRKIFPFDDVIMMPWNVCKSTSYTDD